MTQRIYRPTVLTLIGLATTIASISATAGFMIGRLPLLQQFVPVHFDSDGVPDRWRPASYGLVLFPVWIQLTLAVVFAAIGALLLYRTRPLQPRDIPETDANRQDRERMVVTAEAVILLSAIWVTFQSIAATRVLLLWQRGFGGLGGLYGQSLVVAVVLSIVVGIRAAVHLRHPTPAGGLPEDGHWGYLGFYFNPDDPALFVPRRRGPGWTVNFGRRLAVVYLLIFLSFGVGAPLLIARLLLGR